MQVWMARNKGLFEAKVSLYKEEPKKFNGIWVSSKGWVADIDIKSFKRLFGYTPRKGTCEKGELTFC